MYSFYKYLKPPWLEISLLILLFLISYTALGLISLGMETPPGGMPAVNIFILLLGFFLFSFMIATIAVISGIGGGVLFTPVMLAFTPIDSLIIRATGLVVAMFSGLISTGPHMKRGIGNLRMSILFAVAYGTGAFFGAQGSIFVWRYLGEEGEAAIRIALGIIIALVAAYFIFGGQKLEWPKIETVDRFTRWLNLSQSYYEPSLDRVLEYKVTRAGYALAAIFFVGIISGFFGLGAGWAIVPVQNLVMGVPLKVAAANSTILIGMGDCIAVWPYLLAGALIPLFVAPWVVGLVLGGRLGAFLLYRVKAEFVRLLLIAILFFTSISLVIRGLEILEIIRELPGYVSILIFAAILLFVMRSYFKSNCRG